MALNPCAECGAQISTTAKTCPQCGAKQPKRGMGFGKLLLIGFAALPVIVIGMSMVETEKKPEPKTAAGLTQGQTFSMVERAKDAVRKRLKDPASAEFRGVRYHEGKEGLPMVCGEVNAKNAFGGRAGFEHFVSTGAEDKTFFESDVSDFANLWNRFCT